MIELGTIRIRNAVFYAYHGVSTDEQNLGRRFEVDVDLWFDMAAATETDSLRRTVDYERVYDYIQRVVTAKKYYLLEALSGTIAEELLKEFPALEKVAVRVRKPHPPVKGVIDCVEVEVTKSR
jgi:dihydroneopterin aldolase